MPARITVFGGARVSAEEPAYQEALLLGRLLGEAGYTVQTGGYIGTMEAVSRGAAEAGAHVIGITCDEIEHWRPISANAWVQEELRYPTLRQRMLALIDNCSAALVLPGGIGTLAELAVTWSFLATNAITPRPLIAIGSAWSAVIEQFYAVQGSYIPAKQRAWLSFAPDAPAAVAALRAHFDTPAGLLSKLP